jgi:hypothetical protein
MRGPLSLWPYLVDMSVPGDTVGVFCLGRHRDKVCAVLRADHDLREQIKSYRGRYAFFWFEAADSPEASWIIHCSTYHRLMAGGTLDDTTHPVPMAGTSMACVTCGKQHRLVAREIGIGLG